MNILKQSIHDLTDDFDELIGLYNCTLKNLQKFQKDIKAKKRDLLEDSLQTLYAKAEEYSAVYQSKITQLIECKKQISTATRIQELSVFSEQKTAYTRFLREHIGVSASLIVSTDWQSPSFMHSLRSEAGKQTGAIEGTINDYKRDQHLDERPYEQAFIREYIQDIRKAILFPYMTNSGMAAFTTILNYLLLENKSTGTILLGKSIWFENKELIKKSWKNCIEVAEHDTANIINTIKTHTPNILFFDSLCNAQSMDMPDIATIIKTASKYAKTDTYIIIDNSCLSLFLQPLSYLPTFSKIRLIIFESLNKYHQFGLDRITAGYIWALGGDTAKLFTYREHLGTNISDASVHILPTPNKTLLKKRMLKLNRNAKILAHSLQKYIDTHDCVIESINYPGLPTHPCYEWAKTCEFTGSFFPLAFKWKYKTVDWYNRFVKLSIDIARKKNVQLVGGTSFGLNTTRIYLTALRASIYGDPFIRISAGTETLLEIERLKEVFIEAIRRL